MRIFLLAAMAAVALFGAGLGGALGQSSGDRGNRWVEVTNDSHFIAVNIYIVPSKSNCCWSRDLLETEIIWRKDRKETDPENVLKVNFDDGSRECVFDIRVTTQFTGWEWLFADVNVCSILKIRLEGEAARSNDERKRRVTIKNESRFAARNVYAIPAKSSNPKGEQCCWSYDLLRAPEIPKDDEYTVDFDDSMGNCEFHIRITSEKKGTDWYLKNVDVCRVGLITLRTKSEDGKRRLIEIGNKSRAKAVGAFIIPEGKRCCWSNNLLGDEGIAKDESVRVDIDDESGECRYEYRITRNDKGREWEGKLDVCSEPTAEKLPVIPLPKEQP